MLPETMFAAVLYGPNDLRLEWRPVPMPGPDEVLIRVHACAICGSDPKLMGTRWPYPIRFGEQIPGHEYSGEIVALGPNVDGWHVGERIAVEAHKGCGKCANCRMGRHTICLNYGHLEAGHRHYGFTANGGYAEFVVNHVNTLYRIPDGISYSTATLVTTAGCVLYAFESIGGYVVGDTVAILGPGPIGLMAVQIARALCAGKIIITGRRPDRLAIGKACGADVVVDVLQEDPVAAIRRETGGAGADLVLECSGDPAAAAQCVDMVARGGRICFVGNPNDPTAVNTRRFTLDNLQAVGIRGEGRLNCGRAMHLFRLGKLSDNGIITHHFALKNIHDALETFVQRKENAIKVVIEPGS
jgi:threonine dehydrogenase-like Zn-dependent dehydrogenase